MVAIGNCRFDLTLQPVSGKAVPVYRGEVLRIIQVEGEQCVDFNCFNLHDYKERMSVGHMRRQGFRLKQGHFVVSNPPRYRPMMFILSMPDTCVPDLLGARCDATGGEREYGFVDRPNCQDTLAESIGEYGLTPDDVHDSFNMFMNTTWNDVGSYTVRNTGQRGDYVDLLAIVDVLAVPIVCGSGDIGPVSNYSYKPLQIQVFEAAAETNVLVDEFLENYAGFKNQRTPEDFRVKEIKKDRELRRIPGYEPEFRSYPIRLQEIEVEFSPQELQEVQGLRGIIGKTEEEAVRAAFMLWYQKNRMRPHWVRP
jgi:uncharacterized protein YcgI (DUF1989 family)